MIVLATQEELALQAELLRAIADRLVASAAVRAGLPAGAASVAPALVRGASEFVGEQLGILGNNSPAPAPKRRKTAKAVRGAKKMSKALKQANQKYRKKNGDLRAGRTQADIMRYAHKLRRKM